MPRDAPASAEVALGMMTLRQGLLTALLALAMMGAFSAMLWIFTGRCYVEARTPGQLDHPITEAARSNLLSCRPTHVSIKR